MKICTITCHDVYNFGASLQAYALQHYLESLGHEVKVIDYRPSYLYKKYNWKTFTSRKFEKINSLFVTRWVFRFTKWCYLRFSLKRKKRFDEFTQKYLHLTPISYYDITELKNNPPIADAIIAGSDQIWNPVFPNGKDPSFYIDFALPNTKRISYAASFSVSKISEEDKKYIKKLLSQIDVISVREYQGINILEEMGFNNCIKVLDPIFLIQKEEWIEFMNKHNDRNYILIYDFEGNKLLKKTALLLKKKHGLKIYSINDAVPRFYADKNITNVGPQDFIGLIYNCSIFLSNSFHGTAFSIYFNKPFFTFKLNGFNLNSRMDSLLRLVSLENRLIDSKTNLDTLSFTYDYESVNRILSKEIMLSKNFLNDALTFDKRTI